MPCCTVVLLHMDPSWTSFPVPSIPRESSVLHVPSAAMCPCLPWALAEEEALPRGVAVWLPSSCCRRSSIVLPGFSFLFTSLSLSRGDPSAPGPTVSSHRELPTSWWQSCCLVICGLPYSCRLWLSVRAPWPHTAHGLLHGFLWPSAQAPQPPTAMSPLLGTNQEPRAPRLLHPEAHSPCPSHPCFLPMGSAVPGHGSTRLRWAAVPLPRAFPQLLVQVSSLPTREQERLVPALAWSVAAFPTGLSTGWGQLRHPMCAACWQQEAREDTWSGLQPVSCCAFSCSSTALLRSRDGTSAATTTSACHLGGDSGALGWVWS